MASLIDVEKAESRNELGQANRYPTDSTDNKTSAQSNIREKEEKEEVVDVPTTRLSERSSNSTISNNNAIPEDSTTAKEDDVVGPPPDGGLVAWLQVLAGLMANALTWGFATGFGVFQEYYVNHLGHDASQVAWIGGIQTFLFFFIGAFSGRATDAGLTRPTVLLGSAVLLFGIFMTSLATTYWQILLAQGVCLGVGGGIVFIPILAVLGTYFSKNKAFAVGVSAAGTGVGGLIFPALVQQLIPKIGFPWAVRCMGFVALVMAIIMNVCLKPRLPPRRSGSLVELSAFKEPVYTFYAVGTFLIFWALFVGFAYINLYARQVLEFSDTEAVHLLLIMNAIGIPGRMVFNYVADRWLGAINTMIPASACLSVMFFSWIAIDGSSDRTGLYVFAVFYGFAASVTQGLFAGSLASVTPDLGRLGVRMGMVFALCAFSSLTGSPIAGAITAADGGAYVGAQAWAGCMVLVGSLCLLASRISRTGWVLRKRA